MYKDAKDMAYGRERKGGRKGGGAGRREARREGVRGWDPSGLRRPSEGRAVPLSGAGAQGRMCVIDRIIIGVTSLGGVRMR